MIFSKEELSNIFTQKVQVDIEDICLNSNEAKKGNLFIALKGEKVDGHDFVEQAFANGASLVMIEYGDFANSIKVSSCYEELINLAKYNISHAKAKYIGVTGSVGKTTTKNMIHHLLNSQSELVDRVYVTKKNFNSQLGLPLCAATMPRDSKIGVFEMGMSSAGHIRKLINVVAPNISVITKICEAHLAYFDSVFDIAKAKAEIFESTVPQEAAIIPADSPYSEFLESRAKECGVKSVYKFGLPSTSAFIESVRCNSDGSFHVTAKILGDTVQYDIDCGNKMCVENSLPSLLAAHLISGLPVDSLAQSLRTFISVGRQEINHSQDRDIIIIDDTYNACPTSMHSAIMSLGEYANRRKILVIGDMLELGRNAIHYHENLSATVDKFNIDLVFACGELSKHLFDNLQSHKKGAWASSSQEIAPIVANAIQGGDCVLVKGSHSMEMQAVVKKIIG